MIDEAFWKGKKVFITGHTGFKGTYLCLWLHRLGADITGFSLEPPTEPSLFEQCRVSTFTKTIIGDIRDPDSLRAALIRAEPEMVIHLAAQPLVRASYIQPLETFATNVMGTVHLLEAVREAVQHNVRIKAVLNVTSDKCYENKEWHWGYRENEPLGGHDPYSSSKACSELVAACYRSSYFHPAAFAQHGVALATARAGNVIGGGDWAADRLIPDCVRALINDTEIKVRNPRAIRPWQHVLEPLSGYLVLLENLYLHGMPFAEAWNFGPAETDAKTVEWIVKTICGKWGPGAAYRIERLQGMPLHEAQMLALDCSKARARLGWTPVWRLGHALGKVVEWARAYKEGQDPRTLCLKQIEEYSAEAGCHSCG